VKVLRFSLRALLVLLWVMVGLIDNVDFSIVKAFRTLADQAILVCAVASVMWRKGIA